jgi:hypothetical protein
MFQIAVERFVGFCERHRLALPTLPGPLIIAAVVSFLATWHRQGASTPGGHARRLLTTWATFLPSVTFILLGAPTSSACATADRAAALPVSPPWSASCSTRLYLRPRGSRARRKPAFALALVAAALIALVRFRVKPAG